MDQPGPSTSVGASPPWRSARFTSHTHVAGRARVDSDSDEWLFFFFFSFWYLMPKGDKIRGVNRFSTPCVLCCCALCSDPMRVVVRLWVWESLKTLFYEIMLLYDFICFGYGHVFMVIVLACHILCLNCFISIWSAIEIWLLPDWHSQDGSAALWGR